MYLLKLTHLLTKFNYYLAFICLANDRLQKVKANVTKTGCSCPQRRWISAIPDTMGRKVDAVQQNRFA